LYDKIRAWVKRGVDWHLAIPCEPHITKVSIGPLHNCSAHTVWPHLEIKGRSTR